jgi:hypothetical protein
MGCRSEWADDTRLVMEVFIEEPWTWDEFVDQAVETFAVIQAYEKPCATTVDVSCIGAMPEGNALIHLTEIETLMPDNLFASAIIGAPNVVTVFMDILARMRPRVGPLIILAKTKQEALDKIQERYAVIKNSAEKSF